MIVTFIVFFFLLFFGLPVAFVLGVASLTYFFSSGQLEMLYILPSRLFEGMDSFVLMAIPLFIFAGEIMNRGEIIDRLVALSNALVGRMRGGLAYANVLGSMFFGGITGSALSDVAALGSMLVPAMEESGYDKEFSTAVTAASAIQGPIIPPSIPAVLVSAATGTSVGALFLGGAIPGVIIGLTCCIIVFFLSNKRKYPRNETKITLKAFLATAKRAFFPLMTPLIILGGILGGLFTPTEASAVAVLYALLLTGVAYRSISKGEFMACLKSTVLSTSKIYLIIGFASVFSWILAMESIPDMMANLLLAQSGNIILALFIINIFVLFWGMWLDTAPAIVILMPILSPVAEQLGINGIHFGVIMVVNLMIGQLTPPFGMTLFTAQAISKTSLKGLLKELFPFLIADFFVLGIVTYIPAVSLYLPGLFGLLD